jgi:hypothetical protein
MKVNLLSQVKKLASVDPLSIKPIQKASMALSERGHQAQLLVHDTERVFGPLKTTNTSSVALDLTAMALKVHKYLSLLSAATTTRNAK